MYSNNISVGGMVNGHVQGIATDKERKYMYYSFTTSLIKTDMDGNVIGSVKGLVGHLGCIAYNYEDGRVYGSLEYKHDEIGADILQRCGCDIDVEDGWYIAIFDVDKIDRIDMDAETDGIMKAVYLDEVIRDYSETGGRYGCAGLDGLTIAPLPGKSDGKRYLYAAYGVYGDTERADNDYQVLISYDISDWKRYESPLNQRKMHRNGPSAPDYKYFAYTGNTTWGVQNLEYDPRTGYMFMAVYKGCKESFPNYPMFAVDMSKPARVEKHCALDEDVTTLTLAEVGEKHEPSGVWGIDFPYGSTGMISLGDGYFYFSEPVSNEERTVWGCNVRLYRYIPGGGFEEA